MEICQLKMPSVSYRSSTMRVASTFVWNCWDKTMTITKHTCSFCRLSILLDSRTISLYQLKRNSNRLCSTHISDSYQLQYLYNIQVLTFISCRVIFIRYFSFIEYIIVKSGNTHYSFCCHFQFSYNWTTQNSPFVLHKSKCLFKLNS